MSEKDKKRKVLIIGGGGIYGIIPIVFLKHVGVTDIRNYIDVIAGTSIGGIISLYLAQGKSINSLYDNFVDSVDDIFDAPWWRNWNPCSSKYPADVIEEFLQEHLEGTLRDIKLPTVVPTLDFKKEKPKVYDNIVEDEDLDVPIWKIGRATSAAPTYFPPFGEDILLDGGIIENLPIMTVSTAIKSKLYWNFSDMDVLVLGTGNMKIEEKTLDDVDSYHALNWLNNLLVPFVTKGNEITSNFWAQNIGFNSYNYFNPVEIEGDMDEADQVTSGSLEEKCQKYLEEFEKVWDNFVKGVDNR